jgi:hypothetical protein
MLSQHVIQFYAWLSRNHEWLKKHEKPIENAVAACNPIKAWLSRNHKWLKTLCEKPISAARLGAHNREEVEGHFKDFKRYKEKWAVVDEDVRE